MNFKNLNLFVNSGLEREEDGLKELEKLNTVNNKQKYHKEYSLK